MPRNIRLAAVQAEPLPIGAPLDVFAADLHRVLDGTEGVELVLYPELHLFGSEEEAPERRNALSGQLLRELNAAVKTARAMYAPAVR